MGKATPKYVGGVQGAKDFEKGKLLSNAKSEAGGNHRGSKEEAGNYPHGMIGINIKGSASYGMAQDNEAAIISAEPFIDTSLT